MAVSPEATSVLGTLPLANISAAANICKYNRRNPATRVPFVMLLIYGSTGYTGRLIVAEALARGLRPTLAGRNADAVRRTASGAAGA